MPIQSLTLGLYIRADYAKPEELGLYKEFCETMFAELGPETLLEQTLTAEITGASWRLRRCSAVEAELADYVTQDPMLDESTEKTRRSVERARASAHSLLHRSINQFRHLQTDRRRNQPAPRAESDPSSGQLGSICKSAFNSADLESFLAPPATFLEDLDAILAEHAEQSESAAQLASFCIAERGPAELASNCKSVSPIAAQSASFCKPTEKTPRNAACPCKSGQKYKRCCGRNTPPVLNEAASLESKCLEPFPISV